MQIDKSLGLSRIAKAKINLCLHVVGKRADGFHELQSLVTFAEFGDELSHIAFAGDPAGDSLQISGPFSQFLDGTKDNLVMQALRAFREQWPDRLVHDAAFFLTKNLPIASGIGGGSADAAAMLKILSSLANPPVEPDILLKIAADLGSDIAVCLLEKTSIMQGRGENISPLERFPTLFAVLVNPGIQISTPKIFSGLAATKNPKMPTITNGFASIDQLVHWLGMTANDLEEPAIKLVPQIGDIIEEFQKNSLCRFSRMSGSGATVFALFDNMERAKTAAKLISNKWPKFWVQPTILGA